ncbi:MAG: hypothetical protein ABIU05_04625 [Nitrospirales bacterium]
MMQSKPASFRGARWLKVETPGSGIFSIALFENFTDNPPSRSGTKWLNPSTALTRHASHALRLTLTEISLTSDYEKAHHGVLYS